MILSRFRSGITDESFMLLSKLYIMDILSPGQLQLFEESTPKQFQNLNEFRNALNSVNRGAFKNLVLQLL